jgi:hypothetical protein
VSHEICLKCFVPTDPRHSLSADPARSRLQGDEYFGSCSYAEYSSGPGSDWRDLPNIEVRLSDGNKTKKLYADLSICSNQTVVVSYLCLRLRYRCVQ